VQLAGQVATLAFLDEKPQAAGNPLLGRGYEAFL
jgi:hypothetical protein